MVISDPTGGMGSGPPIGLYFPWVFVFSFWGFWCENLFQIPFATPNLGGNPFLFGFCFGVGLALPEWFKFLEKGNENASKHGALTRPTCGVSLVVKGGGGQRQRQAWRPVSCQQPAGRLVAMMDGAIDVKYSKNLTKITSENPHHKAELAKKRIHCESDKEWVNFSVEQPRH